MFDELSSWILSSKKCISYFRLVVSHRVTLASFVSSIPGHPVEPRYVLAIKYTLLFRYHWGSPWGGYEVGRCTGTADRVAGTFIEREHEHEYRAVLRAQSQHRRNFRYSANKFLLFSNASVF